MENNKIEELNIRFQRKIDNEIKIEPIFLILTGYFH